MGTCLWAAFQVDSENQIHFAIAHQAFSQQTRLLCVEIRQNVISYSMNTTALPDRGCELRFEGVQESIMKDEVNIFFRRKEYQLRYFFHNFS